MSFGELIILQDIYMKTMEKCTIHKAWSRFKQGIRERPTYPDQTWAKPTWKQPRPNMQPPCERRSRGGNTWVRPHPCKHQPPIASTWHLLVIPHVGCMWISIFLQTDQQGAINRWERPPHSNTTQESTMWQEEKRLIPIFSSLDSTSVESE
jgi:hypothetical protein